MEGEGSPLLPLSRSAPKSGSDGHLARVCAHATSTPSITHAISLVLGSSWQLVSSCIMFGAPRSTGSLPPTSVTGNVRGLYTAEWSSKACIACIFKVFLTWLGCFPAADPDRRDGMLGMLRSSRKFAQVG